jgi:hypothetical protein
MRRDLGRGRDPLRSQQARQQQRARRDSRKTASAQAPTGIGHRSLPYVYFQKDCSGSAGLSNRETGLERVAKRA